MFVSKIRHDSKNMKGNAKIIAILTSFWPQLWHWIIDFDAYSDTQNFYRDIYTKHALLHCLLTNIYNDFTVAYTVSFKKISWLSRNEVLLRIMMGEATLILTLYWLKIKVMIGVTYWIWNVKICKSPWNYT